MSRNRNRKQRLRNKRLKRSVQARNRALENQEHLIERAVNDHFATTTRRPR